MYLLQTNCTKDTTKSHDIGNTLVRDKGYNLLQALVGIAARFADHALGPIATSFGSATLEADMTLKFDEHWQDTISSHKEAIDRMLTAFGSKRGGPGPHVTQGMAAAMWHWASLCQLCRHERKNKTIFNWAQACETACLRHLEQRLSRWSACQGEPTTARLLTLQPPGKRTCPALLIRIAKKNNKRRCLQQWTEDGLRVRTNVASVECRNSGIYLQHTRRLLGSEKVVELLFDSTMFATRDTEVHIAFGCKGNVAAYLPPLILRQLRWREGAAGSVVSQADLERFSKKGFQTAPHMQTHDCIQAINHVLDIGCDKTLEDFRPKQEFTLMALGSIRIWSPSQKRWMRGAPGLQEMPELTDDMLDPSNINVLLITMDQKQSQWAAGQFLADNTGLGLFVGIREDGFHRAWRDFQLAMSYSKGKLVHTAVQLNLAFNVNYGPFGQGAHMAKRREFQLEWQRLMPAFGEDFEALVGNIALDSGLPPPRSVAELQSWYNDLVLGNETYEKKAPS